MRMWTRSGRGEVIIGSSFHGIHACAIRGESSAWGSAQQYAGDIFVARWLVGVALSVVVLVRMAQRFREVAEGAVGAIAIYINIYITKNILLDIYYRA